MGQKNMTALVSAFSRVYHYKKNNIKIFKDTFGEKIITDSEYEQISNSMIKGIQFFNPEFIGSEDEALEWIVDNQLSPSTLGRAAYTERMLENAIKFGAKQYFIFAAGYDTFAYRQPKYAEKLQIFEIDHPLTSKDKQSRISSIIKDKIWNLHFIDADFREKGWEDGIVDHLFFNPKDVSFCSLLGISYYLSKEDFQDLICTISQFIPIGSSLVFDYPDENTFTDNASERTKKQVMIANASGEKMIASYGYEDIEYILSQCGFLIYEHLIPNDITNQYFREYNDANPDKMITAFDNVNYCLAVKRVDS